MSSESCPKVGAIVWQDLTVTNAEDVRDFYKSVVGWDSQGEDMGGYEDFHMISPATGSSVAGICHARGENANIPPQWLVYINVRSEEHTSELQSHSDLVCRLLLEKKKKCMLRK